MPNPASVPAREAGPGDELAGILRDCADRVPGSLERLLARYDEHLRAHVGSTLAGAAVAGPALRAALATACAEAADFDPAREPAEAWLAARVRRARVAAGLVQLPARTAGEPSDREAVPASPAAAPRPREFHPRVLGPRSDDGLAEPPRPTAPGGDGDDGEPGLAAPDREVGNGTAAHRDGDAGGEDAGTRRAGPAEPAAPPPAAEEVDYRWVANYQRAEIRFHEARVQDLERRLRLRTAALLGALALAGLGAAGGAYLALGPLVRPEPVQATRTAPGTGPGPGRQLSGTADPAATARVPGAGAGPEPAAAPPDPPAAVREAGPLPSPETGPPPRAGGRPAAPTPGVPAERTALEELEAKDPAGAGAANGTTGSDPGGTARPAGGAATGTAAPQPPPDEARVNGGEPGAAAAPRATVISPRGEAGAPSSTSPSGPTPVGRGGEGGSGATAPPPSREGGGAAEGGTSGPPAPPSAAAGAGPSVPAPATGDATSRRPAAAPPVPAEAPRGAAGRADHGNAAAEALRAALAATRRSLEGPGDTAGRGAPPSGGTGPEPR